MKKCLCLSLMLISLTCVAKDFYVSKVTDGDTFVLSNGDKVRMIGINAPENKDIYGKESKHYLEEIILNKSIILKKDEFGSDKDRYGRLLRYVFNVDIDINKKMIEEGYAFAYLTYNFEKANQYKLAQLSAKRLQKGMWGSDEVSAIVNQEDSKITSKELVIGFALLLIFILCGFSLISK